MAWPSQIIDGTALLKHIYEQGADRILEGSNNYTSLYQSVTIEMRQWLEQNRVSDADDIVNTTDYEIAAANLAWSRILRGQGRIEDAKAYYAIYASVIAGIQPQIVSSSSKTNQGSGTLAPSITKQGSIHYTNILSRHVNKPYRS